MRKFFFIIPPGGLDCFGSGFLPASYQGSVFLPQNEPVANIKPKEKSPDLQKNKLSLLSDLDHSSLVEMENDPQVEAAIQNYETAYQMQTSVPELMDLSGESEVVKNSYGMDSDMPKSCNSLHWLVYPALVDARNRHQGYLLQRRKQPLFC